ncbi:MAG: DUF4256 domain-containing protein [Limisphaerales bacterium]
MTQKLTADQIAALLQTLRERFEHHSHRHPGLDWESVRARLAEHPSRLWSLHELERTGGEPDVVGQDGATGAIMFVDCARETPPGRVSLCYDRAGRESRKEPKPRTSAQELAAVMGVELLSEAQYFALQELGEFDTKTSSWLATPPDIRERGGALYGERRYGRVFIGHNGAQSYFAVRGFRAGLRV